MRSGDRMTGPVSGSLRLIRLLFIQSHMKFTALGIAALRGNTGTVTMLVKAGADVNYQNEMVGVALFLALCSQSRASVPWLGCVAACTTILNWKLGDGCTWFDETNHR
jgi:hypothetical protein